jgi:type I restriction enzyme, S subunit
MSVFDNHWQKTHLGALLAIKHGFAFRGEYFADRGSHIVLTPGNFNEHGGFIDRRDKAKWYQGPIPEDYVLPAGSLLVAMTEQAEGLLGSSAIVPCSSLYLHNQRLGLVQAKDPRRVDTKFLYYLFNHRPVRQQIRASASGTKIRHTSPTRIEAVVVPVPSITGQRRIASILSAYDDLIENCQRRIRILEDMARGLYREWFVHFRFPGADSLPRVDSPLGPVPQGWLVCKVADCIAITGGGTPSREEPAYWEGGQIQWYSPRDLTAAGSMFIEDSADHINELGLAKSSARLFPARSVMLTSRATIGAIAINTNEACTNQGFITCLPNERVPLHFLYYWLRENVSTFERLATGATFKEISRGVFKTIDVLLPPNELLSSFERLAEPMAGQVLALQRKITNLRCTRDLLLRRLMSGQIDLSATEEAVAA